MKLRQHIDQLGLTLDAYGQRVGCNVETIRRYCLPFDHPKFQVPRRPQMRRIYVESNGVVTPNDFYDLPDLSSLPANPSTNAQEAA